MLCGETYVGKTSLQISFAKEGVRLYSRDDIRRLALLRQLVDAGHAIGTIAEALHGRAARSPAA